MTRIIYLILAYFFLALAIIGVFLPGLPTVPFLLLTAWLASKGSERLHSWLYAHPKLGKLLTDWEQYGAVSRASKILAICMLTLSWVIIYHQMGFGWVLMAVSILFVSVAGYLLSRPEPKN